MLAGGNEKFPPANILSFLPSHYNDYHAFVSSTEHGFFRILGEMSLRGQERKFMPPLKEWPFLIFRKNKNRNVFLNIFWGRLPHGIHHPPPFTCVDYMDGPLNRFGLAGIF